MSPGTSQSRWSRINRLTSLSLSFQSTAAFLRRHLYTAPALMALVLGAVGWWVHATVQEGMRRQTASELQTVLNGNVTALEVWMHEQEANAQSLAAADGLDGPVRELLAIARANKDHESALTQSRALANLRAYLKPRLKIFGYRDFFVVSTEHVVLAAGADAPVGKELSGYQADFFERVLLDKPSVSRPFRSILLLPDAHGQLKASLPTMFTAAAIRDSLARPRRPWAFGPMPSSHVLRSGTIGESGETYAFDGTGLLLSQSRLMRSSWRWDCWRTSPTANPC